VIGRVAVALPARDWLRHGARLREADFNSTDFANKINAIVDKPDLRFLDMVSFCEGVV
jgi:hypothetical protein